MHESFDAEIIVIFGSSRSKITVLGPNDSRRGMNEQDNFIGVSLVSSKKQFQSFAYQALDHDDFWVESAQNHETDRF